MCQLFSSLAVVHNALAEQRLLGCFARTCLKLKCCLQIVLMSAIILVCVGSFLILSYPKRLRRASSTLLTGTSSICVCELSSPFRFDAGIIMRLNPNF